MPAVQPTRPSQALWARGFRPFFLGGALHAALLVPLWTAIWLGAVPAPRWLAPTWWHAHEMLFGTVAAAIAGFLLTASPVWSGRPALAGRPLLALAMLWLAGRVALGAAGWLPLVAAGGLPQALVAAVDLAFLPVLAGVLARTLWGREQRRHHGIVVVVGALAVANAVTHAEALGLVSGLAPRALRLAVDGVVVLIVVIGGRITPAFTANALRRAGLEAEVWALPLVGGLAIAGVAGVALADLLAPGSIGTRVLAGAAGIAVLVRMAGWQTLRALSDPLLWSLHAGLAWVGLGLLLVAVDPRATVGLHALTAGAMGSMILAVMTRVGLGHTGRPLVLPPGAVAAYALVHAGAVARVAAAVAPAWQAPLLALAGLLWGGAFAVFAAVYAPILLRPRPDGKPG